MNFELDVAARIGAAFVRAGRAAPSCSRFDSTTYTTYVTLVRAQTAVPLRGLGVLSVLDCSIRDE